MKRKFQSGSITVEYLIVSTFIAMVVWAGTFGLHWATPRGEVEVGGMSVSRAMHLEHEAYAAVIANQ